MQSSFFYIEKNESIFFVFSQIFHVCKKFDSLYYEWLRRRSNSVENKSGYIIVQPLN